MQELLYQYVVNYCILNIFLQIQLQVMLTHYHYWAIDVLFFS